MSSQEVPHPPLYQSPQFQHEFPSLSSGDGGPTRTGSDAPYPSGLSLRPQTEGSWTQGGQRTGSEAAGPPRPGSVPPGAPPQLSAQAGLPPPQQQPFPPQIRGVMPSFVSDLNFFYTLYSTSDRKIIKYNLFLRVKMFYPSYFSDVQR